MGCYPQLLSVADSLCDVMFAIHFILLFISLGAIWIIFNDDDEVHNIAAIFVGAIALIWGFILIPMPAQLAIALILSIICRKIRTAHHEP